MAPFRWPNSTHDIDLATKVVANPAQRPEDWNKVAATLSIHFSPEKNPVQLTGRACRERFTLLLTKHKADDARALKR